MCCHKTIEKELLSVDEFKSSRYILFTLKNSAFMQGIVMYTFNPSSAEAEESDPGQLGLHWNFQGPGAMGIPCFTTPPNAALQHL